MILPRYIVGKPQSGFEDEKQEDYERQSDFFVTAQSTEQVNDNEPGNFAFKRFDVSNGEPFLPQNYDVMKDGRRYGIPVHDACWKIFEKVSEMRLGRVDLQGLVALWWREACSNCGFRGMRHDSVIAKCRQHMWVHKPGTEVNHSRHHTP